MEVDSSLVAHSEEPLPSRSRDGAVTQQTDSWTSEALVTRSQSRGTEPISSTLPPSSLVSQDCLLSGIGLSSVVVLGSGIRASNLCFINCPVATTPPAPVHSSSTLHLDLLPLASMEGTTSSGSHPYNLRPYPFPEPFLFSWMRTLSLPYLWSFCGVDNLICPKLSNERVLRWHRVYRLLLTGFLDKKETLLGLPHKVPLFQL